MLARKRGKRSSLSNEAQPPANVWNQSSAARPSDTVRHPRISRLWPEISITHSDPRPGDVDRHFADTEKAKRLFGFEALTDLETGLAKTVEWLREAGIAERVDVEATGALNQRYHQSDRASDSSRNAEAARLAGDAAIVL